MAGLNVDKAADTPRSNKVYIATERLSLTATGEVVKSGDPRGVSLLVGKGQELPMKDAIRYGLVAGEGSPAPARPGLQTETSNPAKSHVTKGSAHVTAAAKPANLTPAPASDAAPGSESTALSLEEAERAELAKLGTEPGL
jgi:hypothetical protein